MIRTFYRKIIGIGLICSITIAMFIGFYSLTIPNGRAPVAVKGVLDLSRWNFAKMGLANLSGQWTFYPGQLIDPGTFAAGRAGKGIDLDVPDTWDGKRPNGGMTRKGFGTYRLVVDVQDADRIYGLKVRSIRMAHRLYVDGKLEGESGMPGAGKADAKPGNTPYTASFKPESRRFEIVIQVANYEFTTGGIVNSIQLGLNGDIAKLDGIQLGTDIAFILIAGMFASYHLSLYFLSRREKLYLLTGLYLVCIVLMQLLYGEKILLRLAPGIPFELAYKLLECGQMLSAVIIFEFYRTVDKRILSRGVGWAINSPILLYLVAIIFLPYSALTEVKPALLAFIGLVSLYLLVRMIAGYWAGPEEIVKRNERLLFIGGMVSLLVFLVDDALYAGSVVSSDLPSKAGIVAFITFMNILLATRFDRAYAEAENLSRKLIVANELKDEFLTQTSHELKTPLHGILNIASLLLDDEERNLSDKQKKNLWLVKDTSQKLSMLIRDLIDVTRLRHGEMRLQMTVVDLRVAVQIVFDMLQFELAGKQVRLDNRVASDAWVAADESRLRQILYNLVHNAMKHTEHGTIAVTASESAGRVSVFVDDTGSGIPAHLHEAIFHYFEQEERRLPQDGYTGMGVGLYISRKLVERMDGDIRVARSEVGQGTSLQFSLAAARPSKAMLEAAASAERPRREADSEEPLDFWNAFEHTILIVDDEASNIHTLLNILKRRRYNVVTAFSAKEAMRKIERFPDIDLVILDVMMPGLSGIELCRTLRDRHSILDLPILFATVKDSPQDIALGFRAGANDYITKPFEGETLLARIQTLISMKTSIREAMQSEQAFHQAQIKPHFLYNALSSVISFCYTDGEKAAYLLTMLSHYLRYILDMDRTRLFVPLYRELELIEAYVAIEKARFGGRFNFVLHVDEGAMHRNVPPLSIQPFVENAIRHGLFEKDGEGTVKLTIQEGDRYLKAVVEDDGVGIPDDLLYRMMSAEEPNAGGIGIRNIRRRLASIQGAAIGIDSELGKGTRVTMYVPFEDELERDWPQEGERQRV